MNCVMWVSGIKISPAVMVGMVDTLEVMVALAVAVALAAMAVIIWEIPVPEATEATEETVETLECWAAEVTAVMRRRL